MASLDNMPTAESADLELAVAMLLAKGRTYNTFFAYYEGAHPLVYSHERLKEAFDSINARFTQNWCAVVVDSVLDRLTLQRITVADNEAATDKLDALLDESQLLLEADDVHLAALVTGEAYVIAWPDEESQTVEAYYNDPRNVHVFYEADKPRTKRFACKWWIGDDGHRYLTLYYPDRLEYYRSTNAVIGRSDGLPTRDRMTNEVTNGKSFVPYQAPATNEYGIVPVFHFRRERRVISSELTNVIYPQDAINKLLADMMIAAEFGAFKQRWVISQADTSKLKNSPNEIWNIPAGVEGEQNTSVGEFDITPLENYLNAIDKWTTSVAIISRTPKHYFYGQGGEVSGEALIAMESPLNHKAQKYIDRFSVTWAELAQFMAKAGGIGELEISAIVPVYDSPVTVQPYTQSLIRKESVAAGIPLMWQMQQEGYTEQELAELEAARTEAQEQEQETLAASMVNAQRNFDQGGGGTPPRGARNSNA